MKKLFVFILGLFIIAGCGKNEAFEPVEIDPEIDVCEICNMSIAHEHYATEIISKDGDVYKFDDIVCMVEFTDKEKALSEDEIGKQYVRDVNTGEWIELEQAYFAYHEDFWTPMASGLVPFKEKEDAEQYIQTEGNGVGEVYDYEKLKEHPWSWKK